jgi:L-glutamine-phosphate cytidylyltransferase
MDVIILASGIGKRLGALGAKTPKCLLNISKNYKIIDKIIFELNKIKKITMVVGYKSHHIKNYLTQKNIRFVHNKNYKDKGNYYSVLICKNKIKGDVIILDADILLPKGSLKHFISDKRKNLVMVNPKNRYDADDIILNLNKKNIVNKVSIKKMIYNSKVKYSCAGVIKMTSHSAKIFFAKLNKIYKSKNHDTYYEEAYEDLFKKKQFEIYTLKQKRLEVDTSKDYKKIINILKKKNEYFKKNNNKL